LKLAHNLGQLCMYNFRSPRRAAAPADRELDHGAAGVGAAAGHDLHLRGQRPARLGGPGGGGGGPRPPIWGGDRAR
jgi:hypothetical protein